MSSYGSNKSAYLHPQYQQQQPPYPTTPGPAPLPQQAPYYPPHPPPHQPIYSSSPTSQPFYSSSPTAQTPRDRRSSSSSHRRPSYDAQGPSYDHQRPSMAIPIRPPNPAEYHPYPTYAAQPLSSSYGSATYAAPPVYAQQQPVYARTTSQHSQHMYDGHAWADGEDRYEGEYGRLDEATEREYEKRYARERAMERRPTVGESLLSAVGKLGSVFGGKRG